MATKLNFNHSLDFEYGKPDQLAPQITRIIANNPSPITFKGTGTYVIGNKEIIIIDAGPKDKNHLEALLKFAKDKVITHILVTHSHADHYPLSYELQKYCDAKIYGHKPDFSDALDDIGEDMHGFIADIELNDGDIIENNEIKLKAIYTPGHSASHFCFEFAAHNALFCGDHIMGWSSTVVLPPDGNMTLYMENLQKIADLKFDILYPTHGAPIAKPNDYINALINHRLERDEQIIRCIENGIVGLDEILLAIYPELNPALHSAARKNIQAHLLRLIDLGLVKNIWFD